MNQRNQDPTDEVARTLRSAKPMVNMLSSIYDCLCSAEGRLADSEAPLKNGRSPSNDRFEDHHTVDEATRILSQPINHIVDATMVMRMMAAEKYNMVSFRGFLGENTAGALMEMSQPRFEELETNGVVILAPWILACFQQSHPHRKLFLRFGEILKSVNWATVQLGRPMADSTIILQKNGNAKRGLHVSLSSIQLAISRSKAVIWDELACFCQALHLPPPRNEQEARNYRIGFPRYLAAWEAWTEHIASNPGDNKHL